MSIKKNILIVDDEAFIRTLLEQTLESLEEYGIELLMSANGKNAVQTAQTKRPNVIIMDVMMPEMDGFEACQKIKHLDQQYNPHIILLTARGQTNDRINGATAGADDYMTKPFDPDALLAKVSAVLSI